MVKKGVCNRRAKKRGKPKIAAPFNVWRRHPDLNRRITVLQTAALATWLCRRSEKKWSGRTDLNRRRPPWQGGTLPLSYARSRGAHRTERPDTGQRLMPRHAPQPGRMATLRRNVSEFSETSAHRGVFHGCVDAVRTTWHPPPQANRVTRARSPSTIHLETDS